jgi:carbonic anhydrase/acetyltransferase-like protein (isoleucine patch superfamily)
MVKNQNIQPNIEIYQGRQPVIRERVFVHSSATLIGDVQLADDVSIWPGAIIRGDVNHIRIGAASNIQDLSMLHVSHKSSCEPAGAPLTIGKHVTVGHHVILHGCTIEDECLIGMGSIVMDKVIIQERVLVGAGSLVPEGKVLESGHLYLGSPVLKVRKLTEQELAHFMYSAEHYVRLKNNYINEATG